MVAGGGLREDEKKADRERERVAGGGAGNGTRAGAGGERRRYEGGWMGGWVGAGRRGGRRSFADVVEDEASASVRGMKRLRERDVGQILFPPTSD